MSADGKKTRVAIMGLNSRGKQLLPPFLEFPEVEIAYLCDPDASVIPPALKVVTDRRQKEPKVLSDFRKALDDRSVDVLVCAAPDHWHALATILACQAGKDVYVEKPCSHNLIEGRRMIQAARAHRRVVQVGTQRRSAEDLIAAVERVRSGRLGKVHLARAWITSVRPNIGHESPTAPPPSLDFDLWAGPATNPRYQKNLVPYHWHWRWLYGTGECGNNGIHGLDVARWGLGVDAPEYVSSGGRKYHFDDDQETPDTQFATFDFADAAIEWEHRTWNKRGLEGHEFASCFTAQTRRSSRLMLAGRFIRTTKLWKSTRGRVTPTGCGGTSAIFSIVVARDTNPSPTSKSGITARDCVTWLTSPGGRDPRCVLTRRARRSSTIPLRQRYWVESIATAMSCPRFDGCSRFHERFSALLLAPSAYKKLCLSLGGPIETAPVN